MSLANFLKHSLFYTPLLATSVHPRPTQGHSGV